MSLDKIVMDKIVYGQNCLWTELSMDGIVYEQNCPCTCSMFLDMNFLDRIMAGHNFLITELNPISNIYKYTKFPWFDGRPTLKWKIFLNLRSQYVCIFLNTYVICDFKHKSFLLSHSLLKNSF